MKIFVTGISGKMGKAICDAAALAGDRITGGLDLVADPSAGVYAHAAEANVAADVVIDFSRPDCLDETVALCRKFSCPCVLGTTGYTPRDDEKIAALARTHAVFRSANMSLGVNALLLLVEKAAAMLEGFDIEIIERHHNRKVDAPSGTAHMLCDAAARGLGHTPSYRCGRAGVAKRVEGEIGIHAVRGGTVVGEHEVAFFGNDETITLHHAAASRTVFADGALRAARWLQDRPPALYSMRDMLPL